MGDVLLKMVSEFWPNGFEFYFRTLTFKPAYIENIIRVTCILRNYLRINRMPILENNSYDEPDQTYIFNDLPSVGINAQTAALNVKEKFKDFLFPIKDQYSGNTNEFEK